MKNLFFSLAVIFITTSFVSCSKETTVTPDIITEPCTQLIICQNAGTVVNCACDCPSHFSGVDCSVQEAPSKISITNIRVKRFPNLTNPGPGGVHYPHLPWDNDEAGINANPDIFLRINGNHNPTYTTATIPNAFSPSTPIGIFDFPISPQIQITYINDLFNISLFDEDLSPNEEGMYGCAFIAYSPTAGFPSTIIAQSADGVMVVELSLIYEW